MNKPVMLYDARAITSKPCGVRNVAEHYLLEFQSNFDVVAIVNSDVLDLLPGSIKKVVSNRYLSRFNPISDLWITFLVLRYRPKIFFSGHSFLPVFAFLPEVKVFVCHDLFAVFDKSFFKKRGIIAPLARIYFRILAELSFLRASVVVTPSDTIRQTFSQLRSRAEKVLVINNGICIPNMQTVPSFRRKQILFVGNFRSYKGVDILLDAWCEFTSTPQSADWHLTVVTNEPDSVIAQIQESYPNLERVTFYSRVSDEDLVHLRETSAVFVVPSRQEGFGIPLLESIAAGSIVLCSDIPVFKELLRDFDVNSIRLFETGNSSKLALALSEVTNKYSSEAEEMNLISANLTNIEIIKNKYSWRSAAEKVMSVFQ